MFYYTLSNAVLLFWYKENTTPRPIPANINSSCSKSITTTKTSFRSLRLPGKVYTRVLERRVHPLVEPQVQEEQCGFHPYCGTLNQLFTLFRILEGS